MSLTEKSLTGQKARGKAVNPWSYLTQRELGETIVDLFYRARTYFQTNYSGRGDHVPLIGIEPRP
jgi:hypothetical protein